MKSRCTWTGGCRPTEPRESTAIESHPEVWIRRGDDSPLPGSRVTGNRSGNLIKLTQWPIEAHQPPPPQSSRRPFPSPSTPRRSSLDSDHSSVAAASAARVIPLARWPLSDPRGGRRPIFDTAIPRRIIADNNRYVSDPCAGRQNSDLKFTKKDLNRSATEGRASKNNLFSLDDTDARWSEEDSFLELKDGDRESVGTNSCPTAKLDSSSVLAQDADANQQPQKDADMSKVNRYHSNVMDLIVAHPPSLKSADLLDEHFSSESEEYTSRERHKVGQQGKRGGEKHARLGLMSRLCHRKRSKRDNRV